jgi:pyochelin synthetase
MMSIEELLLSFRQKGVELSLNGDKLKFSAPKNTITEQDKLTLKDNKARIIEYLSGHPDNGVIIDKEHIYDEFPLTDIQSSYLVGQDDLYKYGGTNCKIYSEFEFDELDHQKVQEAWAEVIRQNEMLHAVIESKGVQRVLKEYTVPEVKLTDISSMNEEETKKYLANKRTELTLKQYPAGTWPQFDLEMTVLNNRYMLHFSLDMLVADFVSINLIFDEFEDHYYNRKAPKTTELTFRDIVIHRENLKKTAEGIRKYEQDKEYWLEKTETMPSAPTFPTLGNISNDNVLFRQHLFFIENDVYTRLCETARSEKVTPSNLVLTAYVETLRAISANKSFCIDVTMSDRPEIHPDIKKVVGDFTIASILAAEDKGYETYLDEAKALQSRLWEDLGHNAFSGTEVLRELSKHTHGEIVVPAVFTSTLGAMDTVIDRTGRLLYTISMTPQVLIDCQVLEVNGRLRVNWDVREGVFPENLIESAFEIFRENVVRLSSAEGLKSRIYSELPVAVKQVRENVNNTEQDITATYLYDGFLKSLERTPDAPALYNNGVNYSYRELAAYVVTLRKALSEAGFCKGELAAISISKGVWQIAAVLAILTLGGTYLPLDVHQPAERAEKILTTSGTKYILLENYGYISDGISNKIDVSKLERTSVEDIEIIPDAPDLSSPAYVIFTSGSTGTPKGVVISHEAASNTILDINQRWNVTSEDKLLGLANLGFDLSVYDIFGAFYAGAQLVQATESLAKDPSHWLELVRTHNITIWNSVPAQMKMLTMFMDGEKAENIDSLRLVLLSGDWIPTDLPADIKRNFPNSEIISLGGATEAAIWSIYYPIDPEAVYERSIPYGKPLANQRFYILDEKLQPLTDWVTGSIYIAGKGLALEYLGDKELTDAKFVYSEKLGERLYRTGDIGRYMPDGNIEFQGREDFQIKIRGHRVELGEIESAINEILSPKDLKVIAADHNGSVHIVMFSVLREGTAVPDKEILDEALAQKLPKYMIPSFCKYLDIIPLTKNGKVDVKSLEAMAAELIDEKKNTSCCDADLSETEKNILDVWCSIFNTDSISADENFFDCGGDSVMIVKLITELESRFGYKLTLPDVYECPTIRLMAQAVNI